MSRVDADIDALKELQAALARFGHAQRDVLSRAGDQAQDALATLAVRYLAALDGSDGSGGDGGDGGDAAERALRWQHRVDEQVSVYLVAADRFGLLLDSGLPRAQADLAALIARLEAARAAGTQP